MFHTSTKFKLITGALITMTACIIIGIISPRLFKKELPKHYGPYIEFFEKVYQVMDESYYEPVTKNKYELFLYQFSKRILSQLDPEAKEMIPYIAWRGSHLLVNTLKVPEDTFTKFIPPKPAKEYTKEIYGKKSDIGITGIITPHGYLIQKVEIRSDSYKKGIRPGMIIREIDGKDLRSIDEESLKVLLNPEIDAKVRLVVIFPKEKRIFTVEIVSEEYFKETVFVVPTGIPGICCLNIPKFNKESISDLKRQLRGFQQKENIGHLILDIRGNPGGPPLAIREIAGMFMGPGRQLCYYQKKQKAIFGLISPESDFLYGGPISIMVNKKSGSASELLAGVFQAHKRALIFGKESTAGMAFLKGTHKFEDDSMLAMITGFSFLFNGRPLDLNGVDPDIVIPPGVNDQLKFVLRNIRR